MSNMVPALAATAALVVVVALTPRFVDRYTDRLLDGPRTAEPSAEQELLRWCRSVRRELARYRRLRDRARQAADEFGDTYNAPLVKLAAEYDQQLTALRHRYAEELKQRTSK